MRIFPRPIAATVAAVAVALLAAACSAPGTSAPADDTTATTEAAAVTTVPTTVDDGTSAAQQAATTQIIDMFTVFFDGHHDDVAEKASMLTNNEGLEQFLADGAAQSAAMDLSTDVTAVTFLPQDSCRQLNLPFPCARVVHDLYTGTTLAAGNTVSYVVVSDDDSWKLYRSSFCDLVTLIGRECPAP